MAFVVYPEGLATMSVAPLWSILFFFMMGILGFSSLVKHSSFFLEVVLQPKVIIILIIFFSFSFIASLSLQIVTLLVQWRHCVFIWINNSVWFFAQFANAECVFTALMDEFPRFFQSRQSAVILRGVACAVYFLLGLPMITQVKNQKFTDNHSFSNTFLIWNWPLWGLV